MALRVRINAPPKSIRPRPGIIFKIGKAVPYHTASVEGMPKPGEVGIVSVVQGGIVNAIFPSGGLSRPIQIHAAKSEFGPATKLEAQELRASIAAKVNSLHIYKAPGGMSGSDPEVFIIGADGNVLPAFTFLPNKDRAFSDSGQIRLFYDGFQAEWTHPPQSCHESMVWYVRQGMMGALEAARLKDPKATISHRCVVDITQEQIASAPKDGVDLGCSPSLNVYGPTNHLDNLVPEALPFRFAGFHFHQGSIPDSQATCDATIRAMDKIAGVISVSVLRGLEDERRRQFYGLAGEYRRPAHGIEYRVLSSAVLCHPAVAHLMLDLARCSAGIGRLGLGFLWEASQEEVQECINTLNVDLATILIERNRTLLGRILECIYGAGTAATAKAWKIIAEGASKHLYVDRMETVWRLQPTAHWQHEHGRLLNCEMRATS